MSTEPMTDDEVLNYVQQQRKNIVDVLTKDGVPKDPEDVKVLLGALKDMSGQAIQKKRLKIDEKHNANQEEATQLISQMLDMVSQNSHGSHKHVHVIEHTARPIPCLPDDFEKPVLVEGETSTTISTMDYDSFMSKYQDAES